MRAKGQFTLAMTAIFSHEWILPLKIGDATVCEKGDGSTCENGGTVDVKVQQQVWGTP